MQKLTRAAIQHVAPFRKLNSLYYHYRANRWRFHPGFRGQNTDVAIDRPLFLLGTQGGGLTLTCRILRRCRGVVSVAGDSRHWAGADESQNVLQSVLPQCLSWRSVSCDWCNSDDHNWVYASDDFYPHYYEDGGEVSDELLASYRRILRGLLRINRSAGEPARLIDKSQSYTLRVGLLDTLLKPYNPVFLLLLRDPYAACWRAATRDNVVANLELSLEQKLTVAAQHWANSMGSALRYEGRCRLGAWRFEDILSDPKKAISEICEFSELPYTDAILPSDQDKIPLGSMYSAFDGSKWFPLQADVNQRYLAEIPDWACDIVDQHCEALARRFDYPRPRR